MITTAAGLDEPQGGVLRLVPSGGGLPPGRAVAGVLLAAGGDAGAIDLVGHRFLQAARHPLCTRRSPPPLTVGDTPVAYPGKA